jgi:hypothetical protein
MLQPVKPVGERSPTLIETLADFAVETRFDDLPADVQTETRRIQLDSAGCAFAGTTSERGKSGMKLARMIGRNGWDASVLGTGEKLQGWFNQILATEKTRQFLANVGAEPFIGSSQSLAQFQSREYEKWGRLIRQAKIQVQ